MNVERSPTCLSVARVLGSLHPYVDCAVLIVGDVHLPRLTAHLAVLHIGLDDPAGRIDSYRDGLATVGTAYLGLGVPGIEFTGLQRSVRVLSS